MTSSLHRAKAPGREAGPEPVVPPGVFSLSEPLCGPRGAGIGAGAGAAPETESFVKFLLNFLGAAVKGWLQLR